MLLTYLQSDEACLSAVPTPRLPTDMLLMQFSDMGI